MSSDPILANSANLADLQSGVRLWKKSLLIQSRWVAIKEHGLLRTLEEDDCIWPQWWVESTEETARQLVHIVRAILLVGQRAAQARKSVNNLVFLTPCNHLRVIMHGDCWIDHGNAIDTGVSCFQPHVSDNNPRRRTAQNLPRNLVLPCVPLADIDHSAIAVLYILGFLIEHDALADFVEEPNPVIRAQS